MYADRKSSCDVPTGGRWALLASAVLAASVGLASCRAPSRVLEAREPLHLEDHVAAAQIEAGEPQELPTRPVTWDFADGPGPWKPITGPDSSGPVTIESIDDGIRLHLGEATAFTTRAGERQYRGFVYVDLPDWDPEAWASVEIRARTNDPVEALSLSFNLREEGEKGPGPFADSGEWIYVIDDGAPHGYLLRADWSYARFESGQSEQQVRWRQLGIGLGSDEPGSLDLLSVTAVPKATELSEPVGIGSLSRGDEHRRVLYAHTPARIDYQLRVPEGGRLDLGLGVLREDVPVDFRVRAAPGEDPGTLLLEETVADTSGWRQRSVDLTPWAGQPISLTLEAEAERPGTMALWAAPTVSGVRSTERPNVILYVIDAAGAEYLSVYGYNRSTTPGLERLARRGVLFERAYSNSSWSKPSTPSFATSLHHSVLGGYTSDGDPLPPEAVTVAERLHGAGYQTAVITSNPYAGRMSSLHRGADLLRDVAPEGDSSSTVELHADFWRWREAFPGEPWFVHFQTTDVHWPWRPPAPFAGIFVDPVRRQWFYESQETLAAAAGLRGPRWLGHRAYPEDAYGEAGVDRIAFFDAARGLYDETMAHQDWQLERFVERLEATGGLENTLLIVAADHGNTHGLGGFDPLPDSVPNVAPHVTRIPLIFVWPGHLPAGRRVATPVSMIDVVPTILELAGLPAPEVAQGQSLEPLLLDADGWDPRPVVFDEFYVNDETGELGGEIGLIDGRWAAVLDIWAESDRDSNDGGDGTNDHDTEEVDAGAEGGEGANEDGSPVQLYDLWNDPFALSSVHEEYPELAASYEKQLRELYDAHRALAGRFSRAGAEALDAEQLEALRALGYIQ